EPTVSRPVDAGLLIETSTSSPTESSAAEPLADGAGDARFSAQAWRLRGLSAAHWGEERAVEIVGRSPQIEEQLNRIEKIASFREPVLILGESGVGKECFAQSL